MKFKWNIFRPFLIFAGLFWILGSINFPTVYIDASFFKAQRLKSELRELKSELLDLSEYGTENFQPIDEKLNEIDVTVGAIIDDGRKRHYAYPKRSLRRIVGWIAMTGFVITIFVSWKSDVVRLKSRVDDLRKARSE
ncbi:MAG: hypothetical protein ACI8UO_003727 [Verrucomicrobiales bacterium]|jgi:hypothetical protein